MTILTTHTDPVWWPILFFLLGAFALSGLALLIAEPLVERIRARHAAEDAQTARDFGEPTRAAVEARVDAQVHP